MFRVCGRSAAGVSRTNSRKVPPQRAAHPAAPHVSLQYVLSTLCWRGSEFSFGTAAAAEGGGALGSLRDDAPEVDRVSVAEVQQYYCVVEKGCTRGSHTRV